MPLSRRVRAVAEALRGKRPAQPRRRGLPKALVLGCLAAIGVSLALTGGSYALITTTSTVPGAQITAGSTTITVNGSSAATLPASFAQALGPGQPATTALTIANTGTTPADVAVSSTAIGTQSGSLANYLTARVSPVANTGACTPGLGSAAAPLSGFTSPTLMTLQPGATGILCLELTLANTAPASTQNGSAAFTMTITGTQVAP